MNNKFEEFKNSLQLLETGLNEKKSELFDLLQSESEIEDEEVIKSFEAKRDELMSEISLLEETANKEYEKYKAVNPVEFNILNSSKSIVGSEKLDTTGLEELLTSLSVKSVADQTSGNKKSIGTFIGEYVIDGLGITSVEDFNRAFAYSVPFKFQLSKGDVIAEAEVKSLASVKTLYSNGGTQLTVSGTPVPGFQGYGCSVFEIEDGCELCVEPRNFRELLTVRNMTSGNIIQYDYPSVVDYNAAAVVEHITNPYPTVVQSGVKPESTFTYATAKVYLSKIAHWVDATDDVFDDCSKLADRIDYHLTTGLVQELDRQLIAGSGSNGELKGLLTQPGMLTLNGTTLTTGITSPNIWDKLYSAMLELEANCAKVDGVIINPADKAKVALAKDDNGNYLFPQGNNCDSTMVGCLTLKTSPDVPVGTAIIGEFMNNWIYYSRKALDITVGMKGNDFINNNKTFLAELRGAAILRCPQKMAVVTNI